MGNRLIQILWWAVIIQLVYIMRRFFPLEVLIMLFGASFLGAWLWADLKAKQE